MEKPNFHLSMRSNQAFVFLLGSKLGRPVVSVFPSNGSVDLPVV